MPYTITVTRGFRKDDALSRQTVDTLAEVVRVLNATGVAWTLQGPNGESGDIPLPNGTIIEVRKEAP